MYDYNGNDIYTSFSGYDTRIKLGKFSAELPAFSTDAVEFTNLNFGFCDQADPLVIFDGKTKKLLIWYSTWRVFDLTQNNDSSKIQTILSCDVSSLYRGSVNLGTLIASLLHE